MTRAQQIRRKERDRQKKWDMTVSSIQSMSEWDVLEAVGDKMIREVVQIAQEQGLTIIAIIGLEALKSRDLARQNDLFRSELEGMHILLSQKEAKLAKAKEITTKMKLRYVRRRNELFKLRAAHAKRKKQYAETND